MAKTQTESGFSGFMWECDCGRIEYGEHPPEECPDCFKLDSFIKLPGELAAEREKDMLEDELSEDHLSSELKSSNLKIKDKSKSKKILKSKPKRRK